MQQFSSKKSGNGTYNPSDCPLCPGELVTYSGIYEICHQDEPRAQALLVRHSIFPLCKRCGNEVRYKLVQVAPHISEDPDFVESVSESDVSSFTGASLGMSPVQLGFNHGFRYSQDDLEARHEDS